MGDIYHRRVIDFVRGVSGWPGWIAGVTRSMLVTRQACTCYRDRCSWRRLEHW